jgi:hypothetical protein
MEKLDEIWSLTFLNLFILTGRPNAYIKKRSLRNLLSGLEETKTRGFGSGHEGSGKIGCWGILCLKMSKNGSSWFSQAGSSHLQIGRY